MYWGSEIQTFICPNPGMVLANDRAAMLFGTAAKMMDLFFFQKLCLHKKLYISNKISCM